MVASALLAATTACRAVKVQTAVIHDPKADFAVVVLNMLADYDNGSDQAMWEHPLIVKVYDDLEIVAAATKTDDIAAAEVQTNADLQELEATDQLLSTERIL